MMDIKFIKRFADEVERIHIIVGNCIYFELTENRAKTYCDENGVWIEIINPKHGLIDKVRLPFCNYFEPVRCSPDAPEWTQCIDRDGTWRFEKMYPHTLPKASDYKRIASAMNEYMELFN
jgi:hypothetical protein